MREFGYEDPFFWRRGNVGFDIAKLLESPLFKGRSLPLGLTGPRAAGVILLVIDFRFSAAFIPFALFIFILLVLDSTVKSLRFFLLIIFTVI